LWSYKSGSASLLLICGCCLFEFCRETSSSLVCGVMLLPHFSQSEAILHDAKLGELQGPKYSTMVQLSYICKLSGELPRAQSCIVVSRTLISYLTIFAWWAPYGPKHSLTGFPSRQAYLMRQTCWFLIEISFKRKVASIPQPSLHLSRWRKVTLFPKPRLVVFPKRSYMSVDRNSEISTRYHLKHILLSRFLVC